ncbi:uroporphyrinogen-III C-methyltransferase [Noviherbaspirillum sp.]|uniref:uroporphyrinogen-III C-methyltransferase n=1 Tax=Noviherbaspirillum sp. TaxID=1926288 RepID=UPI002B46C370|nr:uroporphyrinogen-III C-methyltransferase [Noviherbaspirillum sp.]HJV82925.1 uroporphyrinogen-III C-methyltransferase [Noviherbaspirillum sp.]
MNELPPSSDPGQSFQSNPPSQQAEPATSRAPLQNDNAPRLQKTLKPIYGGLSILAVLLIAQWWSAQHEISSLRDEVAQRLKSGETLTTETKVLVKTVQDGMRELQAKVNVLESKQTEAQSQQLALEQLYQELSKNRDDWALAEIEQVLSTASQQLQLAGNVQGAIIALQNADSRLSRSDKPQFIMIRRAIAKDLERLKALPTVDLTGIALRLDSVIGQIDNMPLLSDEKPVLAPTQPKTSRRALNKAEAKPAAGAGKVRNSASDWIADLGDKWDSWTNEMWTEVRQLIRVRNVDIPDALLLSPTQSYYARENLKLRLLNARVALLTRNEAAFRSDLVAAQDAISRYFDTRAKQTQTTQALLRQVQASNISIEMPTLADSLNAVRNYKAKP